MRRERSYPRIARGTKQFKQLAILKKKQPLIKARSIVASPKAIRSRVLYSRTPIAFLQGVDPELGSVSDKKSEIYGMSFRGKVLVFPNAVGSSVGAYVIYRMSKNKTAPVAMINAPSDIITASGCALAGIPLYEVPPASLRLFENLRHIEIEPGGHVFGRNG